MLLLSLGHPIGSMDSPQGTQTFHLSFWEAESFEDSAGERTQDLVSGSITEDLPSPGPRGHSPRFLADISSCRTSHQ